MNSHLSEYVKTLFSSLNSSFLSSVTRNENKVSYRIFFDQFSCGTKKFCTFLHWIDEITCFEMVRKNVTHSVF